MKDLLPKNRPILALAPMQDITDLSFMTLINRFGAPDYFVTEYFRVHKDSSLEKRILRSVMENETGKPIFAQMIGEDVESLVKTAKKLEEYSVAGVDLNLGCPAPTVYNKNAGGGLLRNLKHVDRLLGDLREAIEGRFTVKTRIGFHSEREIEEILKIFSKHHLDAVAIHGRTVMERYQSPIHTDLVKGAVEALDCPVIANGNIVDIKTAKAYHQKTEAAGLMIGRGAIRNPWIFAQCISAFEGGEVYKPKYKDLHEYVMCLYDLIASNTKKFVETKHVNKMKKYMIYISQGVDSDFEYEIRRVKSEQQFKSTCATYLLNETPFAEKPPKTSKLFCCFEEMCS